MTYGRNNDLYWVSTSFIDSLRYTNFLPYVKNTIPNQTAIKGQWFSYSVPDSTFIDDDGNAALTFDAKLTNGSPIPDWLTFDPIAGTFSGIPPIIQVLNIRITATDTAGASASATLKIIVNAAVSDDRIPGYEVARIFPNPTSGMIHIASDAFPGKAINIEISNLAGKTVYKNSFINMTIIDLMDKPRGLYILKLYNDQGVTCWKIWKE